MGNIFRVERFLPERWRGPFGPVRAANQQRATDNGKRDRKRRNNGNREQERRDQTEAKTRIKILPDEAKPGLESFAPARLGIADELKADQEKCQDDRDQVHDGHP